MNAHRIDPAGARAPVASRAAAAVLARAASPARAVLLVLAALALPLLPSCAGAPGAQAVDADQAAALVDTVPDLGVIDVSDAFDAGHLPGALSLPLSDGSLAAAVPTLLRTRTYLVYGRTDADGRDGARLLSDGGVDDVFWLRGSFDAWAAAGFPVQ